jgi:hypothetical protein
LITAGNRKKTKQNQKKNNFYPRTLAEQAKQKRSDFFLKEFTFLFDQNLKNLKIKRT